MKKNLLFLAAMMLLFIANGYAQVTQPTGAMKIYMSEYGDFNLLTNDGTYQIDRASILVGTSALAVFDFKNDVNTVVVPTAIVTTPLSSDFEITGVYGRDATSSLPDVEERINVYSWNNAGYAIVKYNIKNVGATEITANIGLDIIPYLNKKYFDSITYNSQAGVIRYHWGIGIQNIGVKLLSANMSSYYSFEWFSGYYTDANYWTYMHKDLTQPMFFSGSGAGTVTITSQAPVTIAPGESANVFYAFAMANNEQNMLSNIATAKLKYDGLVTSVNKLQTSAIGLKNYPNPVKSATKITYQLPKEGFVSIKVYDALGRETLTLVNARQSSGAHTIDFNAEGLTRGVYSYKLIYNEQVTTSKMMVVK